MAKGKAKFPGRSSAKSGKFKARKSSLKVVIGRKIEGGKKKRASKALKNFDSDEVSCILFCR